MKIGMNQVRDFEGVPFPEAVQAIPVLRKRPKQERSRFLVEAIEEACLKILDNEGRDALGPANICRTAGVSYGSFYQYFSDVDGILAELCRKYIIARLTTAGEHTAYLKTLSYPAFLERVIDVVLDYHLSISELDPDFYRKYHPYFDVSLYFNSLHSDGKACLRAFIGAIDRSNLSPDPATTEFAAHMLDRCIAKMIEETVSRRPDYARKPEFKQTLLRMCLAVFPPAETRA